MMVFSTSIYAQKSDDIIGKYRLPNGLDIEIFKNENKYSGKIIAIGVGNEPLDVKNPDKSLRDEPLLRKVILTGLEFDEEEGEWNNGTMYGPEKGVYFNVKITEIKEKEIVVIGSKMVFRKTLSWEKIL